ncbi:MAG: hypothetical protein CVV00_13520 [Firmicutes bacterium HGW-Firmicutes-5]|nr:MAG: hypothetical protein CVV00_13520 [Firmicutes bacterium HGW-Firmicutes-5]
MSPIWASNTLFVGFSIIVLWIMLFATSQVPELETEPFSLALHVLSELILAVSLLFTGIGYMKNTRWVPYMFMLSMGLLIYSVMNVAGYYGESGNFAMVIIFAVLLVIAVLLTVLTLKEILSKNND